MLRGTNGIAQTEERTHIRRPFTILFNVSELIYICSVSPRAQFWALLLLASRPEKHNSVTVEI